MRPILVVGNRVWRKWCKPYGIGRIYTGDSNRLYNFRPIATKGSKTYAGTILNGNSKVLNGKFKPIAYHTARCTCGTSLYPSNKKVYL
jgi:uncharacterized Zn-binding protein involved in type VI secretion